MNILGSRRSCLLASLLLLTLLFLYSSFHRQLTRFRYVLIRPGMSITQVETILGGPEGLYGTWKIDEYMNLPPPTMPHSRLFWMEDKNVIAVYLDDENKVVDKEFIQIYVPPWYQAARDLIFGRVIED